MLYEMLGETGLRVSRLGFGCMRFPVREDGKIDREKALEMVDLAYKSGVNYFDTAYTYHDGESELFIGEALKAYPRDGFLLATKLPTWLLKTEADVPRLLEEQLAKAQVEYFDCYLLHSLDRRRWPTVRETRAYEQLMEEKRRGRIRALGFSYHGDFGAFCEIVDAYDWDFVQIQTNYVDDVMVNSAAFADKLRQKNVPIVVMEPLRGGFLANLPEAAQAELSAAHADSAAAWGFRWCLNQPGTPLILSGMTTIEQVRENLAIFAADRPLTQKESTALARARDVLLSIKTVPCTACNYCMECPFGVEIPDVFQIYNEYKLFANPFRASGGYGDLGAEHGAEACTRCGACAPMCPQKIEIPDRLAEIHQELTAIEL